MTTALGIEAFEDLARMSGTELVTIDRTTSVPVVERELRWNAVYHRVASGV
jgi:L-arabinose isomerase